MKIEKATETPSTWIEKHFYVPDPRDPVTGETKPPGPIILADHQRRIINEALSRREDGLLKYSLVIYSAIKKSGKSALTSGVVLYTAAHRPHSFVYCLANDGKQADDRLFGPIDKCIRLHHSHGGIYKDVKPTRGAVVLPNATKIEAIPVDAAGEAGAQPLMVAISELWGWNTDAKRKMWAEMTIPVTLVGQAMTWVETYAGESGKSDILEELYRTAVTEASPHPDFLDLVDEEGKPVVWVNESAGTFAYWDTVPRMVWQQGELGKRYYAEQAKRLTGSEFRRLHRNQWVTAVDAFVDEAQWKELRDPNIGELRNKTTPVVLGVDGGISNDSTAIVGVTRHPDKPDLWIAVRFCYILQPEGGRHVNISDEVDPLIRKLCKEFNVVCLVYDPMHLEDMAQRLRRDKVTWVKPFSQGVSRAVADKALYDRIMNREIFWYPHGSQMDQDDLRPTLYQHIKNAGAKKEGDKLRLEKLTDKFKIDAAVALSMGAYQCAYLNIGNKEKEWMRA